MRHTAHTGAGTITTTSQSGEVEQWLQANGFGGIANEVAGKTGGELLAMTKDELKTHAWPLGEAMYTALHGMWCACDPFVVTKTLSFTCEK